MSYAQRAFDELTDQLPDPRAHTSPYLLRALYTLLVLTKGTDTTLRDVHDSWAIWRTRSTPEHPSLIPFDELPLEVQESHRPYMDAIHRTAIALGLCAHVWAVAYNRETPTLVCQRCGQTPRQVREAVA